MANQYDASATAEQLPSVVEAVAKAWPVERWRDVHVMVAVSGGADSVALLRALVELKQQTGGAGKLVAAHYNHRWRGKASGDDQAWVESLAESLGISVEVGRSEAAPNDSSEQASGEEQARNARYAFLEAAAARVGARYVATGHTRDDQIETVLLRIFRGSGLTGLAGIPAARSLSSEITVVRPLLDCMRQQIEGYLADLQQPFRQDATNADQRYRRNWIRNELLPRLRDEYGDPLSAALLGLSEHASETQAWLSEQAAEIVSDAVTVQDAGGSIVIDTVRLQAEPALLVREVCRHAWRQAGWPEQAMGRQQWVLLADYVLASTPQPAITLPAGIRVETGGTQVVLAPIASSSAMPRS
ncbi:MAG: tRNA lysidine(34) synthetase TilS [Planctomycetota bacterium]